MTEGNHDTYGAQGSDARRLDAGRDGGGCVPIVFRSPAVGNDVSFLPDGEVGERRQFIMHLARRLYLAHPDIALVNRPAPVGDARDVLRASSFSDNWRFEVKPEIDRIRFGEPGWRLGYAESAINSYFVFKTLREKGIIPQDVRFQITLPLAE